MKLKNILILTLIFPLLLFSGCNNMNNDEVDNNKEKVTFKTYNNERFGYYIKYPKNWPLESSQNSDGITFFKEDDTKNIKVYASNYMKDISEPYKNANNSNLTRKDVTLDSGIDATIIEGKVDNKYHYEMVTVKNSIEYHFLSKTSVDYYNKNKEVINSMVQSFNIKKSKDNSPSKLTKEKAINIENKFFDMIFDPETVEKSNEVKDYNTKKELISDASTIAEKKLVEDYVDNFYREENNKLYIIPKGGPARIIKESPYKIKKINDTTYEAIQNEQDQMRGKYKLTVEFKYLDGKWKIINRYFQPRE